MIRDLAACLLLGALLGLAVASGSFLVAGAAVACLGAVHYLTR